MEVIGVGCMVISEYYSYNVFNINIFIMFEFGLFYVVLEGII